MAEQTDSTDQQNTDAEPVNQDTAPAGEHPGEDRDMQEYMRHRVRRAGKSAAAGLSDRGHVIGMTTRDGRPAARVRFDDGHSEAVDGDDIETE